MKKLFIAALLMVGMASSAQEKSESEKPKMEKLTAAQRNELHLKKLTLDLDLNANQQKEMQKIIAEQSAKRETAMAERKAKSDSKKLTAEERFAKKSQLLDEQIANKQKVKKILTAEQYAKWETLRENKRHANRQDFKKHKSNHDKQKDK